MFGSRYLPFQSVHSPVQAPAALIEQYQGRPRPEFMAMVKALDDAIGVILAALNTTGRADRTVHLVTTDNGGCFWSFGNKCVNTALRNPSAEMTGVNSRIDRCHAAGRCAATRSHVPLHLQIAAVPAPPLLKLCHTNLAAAIRVHL